MSRMEGLKKLGLPVQYIHGDLHYDNVMVVGDKVLGGSSEDHIGCKWEVCLIHRQGVLEGAGFTPAASR